MDRKVLFTASTYSHILNFHLPYLRAFKEQGWTVHVACGNASGQLAEADRLISVPFEKRITSVRNFRAAITLAETIRREKYDLVCTHTTLAAFFTRLAVRLSGEKTRLVNVVHGYLFDDRSSSIKRHILFAAERFCVSQTDLLLLMNEWDYHTAVRCRLGGRIDMIPGVGVDYMRLDQATPDDGAELRSILHIPADAFVMIYPAEFSARKSQSRLIHAMTLLPENTFLVLPGKGKLLDSCKKQAKELKLEKRVIFPGYVSEIAKWYRMADAAVTASRSEGLPFNVMEAMHMGLPVVASEVKGHTDLITDGVTGLLYPYGDESTFAEQISRLIRSEDLRFFLGANAQREVSRYAIEEVLPLVMEKYMSLVRDPVTVE